MRTRALIILILGTAAFSLGLLLELPLLMMSPMLFDAPDATTSPGPLLIFLALLAYPPLVLLGLTRAWFAFHRQTYDKAMRNMLLPLLGAGLVIAAILWLPSSCAGELGCN